MFHVGDIGFPSHDWKYLGADALSPREFAHRFKCSGCGFYALAGALGVTPNGFCGLPSVGSWWTVGKVAGVVTKLDRGTGEFFIGDHAFKLGTPDESK